MAKGDTQLVMSLVLVLLGSGCFLAGFGSRKWVQDSGFNRTADYGLWETCRHGNGSTVCSTIAPGSSEGYFEATRTIECFALVVYCVTLISCFTADDRHPSESCFVCMRRYIHATVALTAGGLTFLAVVVFGACYKDDDWFSQPALGLSYWLTFAGCACVTAGGVMRVVFIVWPDRPILPMLKQSKLKPQAPAKRTAKTRKDDELGSEPLPPPLRVSQILEEDSENKVVGKKRQTGFKRFFAILFRKKSSKHAVADIATVSDGLLRNQIGDVHVSQDNVKTNGQTNVARQGDHTDGDGTVRQPRLKPALKNWNEEGETSDSSEVRGQDAGQGRRRGRRKGSCTSTYRNRRKKVSIAECFVGYNIPPSPAPRLADIDEIRQEEGAESDYDGHSDVKPYELVVHPDDLRARTVNTPPAVIYPVVEVHEGMDNYAHVKQFVDNVRQK